MKVSMDQYDKAILRALQQDASITNLELSQRIGLSPSACLARTRALKESGVIKKFATILDERMLGLDTMAFVRVNISPLDQKTVQRFIETVRQMPNVLECYTLTGSADFLLKVVLPDMQAYGQFILEQVMEIPCVSHVETSIVVRSDKMEYTLPIE